MLALKRGPRMSLSMTGTASIFSRLGAIFRAIASANRYLSDGDLHSGGLDGVGESYTNILAQYLSTLQHVPGQSLASDRDSVRQALDSWKQSLAQLAQDTLIEQVTADATLTVEDVPTALNELIRQMGGGNIYSPTYDVDANTVSGSWGSFGGLYGSAAVGTGKAVVSVVRPDGRASEHVLAEVLEFVCDQDGQDGGTARSESFSFSGEAPQDDPLHWEWPGGSGASGTVTVVDSADDAGTNLLTNGDFEAKTSNLPDNWTLLVGTAGTTILSEATTVAREASTNAVEFVGDGGGTLTAIAQTFNSETGTTATLAPNRVYHGVFWARKSASLLAGAIQIGLIDGSNAAISDDAATANTLTVLHSTLTTSYAAYAFTFVTPKDMPSTYKIRIRVSTALTSGESIFVDDVTFTEATELYPGGPRVSIHAGPTDFIVGDRANLTISNDGLGEFQQWFQRVFGMRDLGLQLPSDSGGTEAISDYLANVGPATLDETDIMVRGQVIPASRHNTTAGTGNTSVDFTLFNKALFILQVGATDDTVNFKLQEDSDDTFGSPSDISGKAITAVGTTDDNKVWVIALDTSERTERYVRALATVGAEGAAALVSAIALGLDPVNGPGSVSQAAIVDEVVS